MRGQLWGYLKPDSIAYILNINSLWSIFGIYPRNQFYRLDRKAAFAKQLLCFCRQRQDARIAFAISLAIMMADFDKGRRRFTTTFGIVRAAEKDDKDNEKEVGAVEDLMREHGVIRRAILVDRQAAAKLQAKPASVDHDALRRTALLSAAPGGFAAWLGFTIPSALALIAFAYGVGSLGDISHVAWLHGLKIVAVAVVAQAVWRMAQSLYPDRERVTVAIAATLLTLAIPSAAGQIGAIVAGGIIWLAVSSLHE
jgi:hypothetical protein